MNFAIRDDDLNFFYTPKFIEENIKDIWDICPISMSVVPFIKGNWIENTKILEDLGPDNISKEIINKIKEDDVIYDIAENKELVKYIKEKISEKKVYLTIHAIHHRNEDEKLPNIGKNFPIGAEFYTNRDLTSKLSDSVSHLEKIFEQKISVFTPPQNAYSEKGLEAIVNNNLNICGYLPLNKKAILSSVKMLGIINFCKVLFFKLSLINQRKIPFPKCVKVDKIKIMDHRSLQPGTDVEELYRDFDYTYNNGWDFVLSTHSYGFNIKMQESEKTMGEILKEFLLYVKKKNNVEFVTINKIFEENK